MTKVRVTLPGGRQMDLPTGFKGAKITVEYQGLQQTAFLLAAVTNRDLPVNVKAYNSRQIGEISRRARNYFYSDIQRPDESGQRGKSRQTGNFTFGARGGGTFVGVPIIDEQNNTYGFGYPDIRRADQATKFVWRSLEFGLSRGGLTDPFAKALAGQYGPRGEAKFPTRFTFLPFGGSPRGVLFPQAEGAARTGTLVTPQGRIVKQVVHPGIAPKQFITRAFSDVMANLRDGYETVLGQTYKDFNR